MQSRPETNGCGVVQWVVPQPNRGPKKPEQVTKGTTKNLSRSQTDNSTRAHQSGSDAVSINNGETQPVIDLSICRTICIFAKEYLKELQEHQVLINRARSKLVNSNLHNHQESIDTNAIALNDIWRLKVRDEQTNAIETIKRLTNYLRELTYIEKQFGSNRNPTNDDIIDRLADIRTEIVQSLNDFVLSNSDIDTPIVCSDGSHFDYDLCLDAQTPSKIGQHDRAKDLIASNSYNRTECTNDQTNFTNSSSIYKDDSLDNETAVLNEKFVINSDGQIAGLEKRKLEVEKLERDTEELRRLFSDFYGLIKIQGEQIDSIEDNIVIATQRISEGQHNINKTVNCLTILMPVTGCMAGALIGGPVGLVVGGKLGGITLGCASSLVGLLSSYSIQRCISPNKIKND